MRRRSSRLNRPTLSLRARAYIITIPTAAFACARSKFVTIIMCHRPRSPRTLNIYPRSASGCLPLSVPGIMRLSIVTILSLLFAAFSFCSGFVQRPVMTTSVGAVLFLFDNEQQEQCIGDSYADAATDCSSIFERLNERKLQLTKGVGKVR